MRTILIALALAAAAGCDTTHHSTFYDAGMSFERIGDRCAPDTALTSQCGFLPQFYCTPTGICASACNATRDCADGSVCVGAGDMVAGQCRLAGGDGGL